MPLTIGGILLTIKASDAICLCGHGHLYLSDLQFINSTWGRKEKYRRGIMDILVCTDKKYIMPACVLMCSVAENNKEEGTLHFHVFVDGSVGDEERQRVITTANNYDINVDFYRIDKSMFEGWYLGHLSVATYYRLILEDILPQDIHRVIYLDCDMIVRHSLMPLWEMDLEAKSLAAVPDLSEALPERYQRLGYAARGVF